MAFNVDTHLIAAVQKFAGAQCHKAASLVQGYMFAAEVCRRFEGRVTAQPALARLQSSEESLRQVVYQCRFPHNQRWA